MFGAGECTEAPESDLPHVASLQLCPHEEREGSPPPPVQPQLRHLVVGSSKLHHRPVRLPAAPRPQKTLPHRLQQATMLRANDAKIKSTCLLKDLVISFYILEHFNDEGTIGQ